MHRYITEFVGTFFLVATIGFVVANGTALAPIAIGSALMVMVYMGGHISGGHYNPAVSLAVLLRGKLAAGDYVSYVVAQTAGAVAGALTASMTSGLVVPLAPAADAGSIAPLAVEILFTFALALVVLNSATDKATEGNSFYGLAIGFTVMIGAAAGGPISGGAFNPAVGIGLVVNNALHAGGTLAPLWLYLVGPLAGGALAAAVFRIQHPE